MKSFNEYKRIVEDNLIKLIPPIDERAIKLKESMEYSLSAGGKRIRPVLLLASCDYAGGDINDAIPAACAIEYIHTYSLIHDDLPAMDNDDLRRGKPTNHKVYGEDIAILTGDALLNTALEIIINKALSFDDMTKAKNQMRAAYYIARNAGIYGMISGQVADVLNQSSSSNEDNIDFINIGKTARLIEAPVISGLQIAGTDENTINDFNKFAHYMGISFQIVDDILDITGTAEELGKTPGKDARDDKSNYVNLHGIDKAREFLDETTAYALDAIKSYDERADFFRDLLIKLKNRTK